MTNTSLAEAYLKKATARVDVLDLLGTKQAWSDVVREAQEIVELALKGMLRFVGVEPPKWHDVGGILVEHGERFPGETKESLLRMAAISKRLRKERELSFYGDIDFHPHRGVLGGAGARLRRRRGVRGKPRNLADGQGQRGSLGRAGRPGLVAPPTDGIRRNAHARPLRAVRADCPRTVFAWREEVPLPGRGRGGAMRCWQDQGGGSRWISSTATQEPACKPASAAKKSDGSPQN